MKTIFQFLLAISMCASLSSCSEKDKNVIVLFDMSNSIDPRVQGFYQSVIEKEVCMNLSQFDKVTVLPIDGGSETATTELMSIDFFANRKAWDVMGKNSNETSQLKKEALEKFVHQKMEELKGRLKDAQKGRAIVSNRTDIIGALHSSEKYIDSAKDNNIIILSDMEQFSGKVKMRPTEQATKWLEESKGLSFSRLKFAQIHVITGEQLEMSKDYYAQIKTYWQQLLGDRLIDYGSGDLVGLRSALAAR